ncbi:LysM peptidoglycan-binding domain-containing protein|uniref:LysM domain-containing protein n=1 Tax=Dendrosporobacter quercicolus TaxID=146817 RepID=A0A1G9XTW4_9FIRM|nr:LysM domain-containing protein [Dendrosporobacter quercicolus]NSL49084.1 LysM peptidoglycan-binding domain-containing protein [Dendrosporobacter quercicolus DSM 1736]SDN00247.1 LysM domain-containing protein [Dendrosporobacter quercicolus]
MKLILGIMLILAVWSVMPLASSNDYLGANHYTVINVQAGDSVWIIAAKFVSDKEDIRYLVTAIREVNKLNSNARIYPGQQLKIPVPPVK